MSAMRRTCQEHTHREKNENSESGSVFSKTFLLFSFFSLCIRSWRGLVAHLAVLVLPAASLSAHPSASTAVSIVVRADAVVELRMTTDAAALLTKLETLAMAPASAAASRETRVRRLSDLRDTLLAHVELRIDDVPAALTWQAGAIDDAGLASVRLTARLPAAAQTISWKTSLIFGSYPLGVSRQRGEETVVWLAGAAPSERLRLDDLAASTSVAGVIWMGLTHIVPKGIDHILFVLGLFLLARGWKDVLWQVSAFTVAHSMTLGLSLFGLVAVPAAIVEPLIALSVAYVGIESLIKPRLHAWRLAVVFAFGLLHGLGFAEALASLSLTSADLLAMLAAFNAGVELGQLAVIAVASTADYVWSRAGAHLNGARLVSAGIGLAGVIWTIERVI